MNSKLIHHLLLLANAGFYRLAKTISFSSVVYSLAALIVDCLNCLCVTVSVCVCVCLLTRVSEIITAGPAVTISHSGAGQKTCNVTRRDLLSTDQI